MMQTYFTLNAWREALARIFEGFAEQDNVSPAWLVNPSTNRRLKLDKFYPEISVAVRFKGLTAKGQGRKSDLEILEEEARERTRAELCREHGVHLATIDLHEDPVKQIEGLIGVLARAGRSLAQSDRPAEEKARWMPALAAARSRAEQLRSRLTKDPEQMLETLAAAWRDREANLALQLRTASSASSPEAAVAVVLKPGQRVRHVRFGEGVITQIQGEGPEAIIVILFDAAEERTFRADLLADKVEVLE
ncbi:MAG: hypothetical protein NZ553_04600 [Caldilinea sp.]|nr:hypothetical protein [Caldilinea sp.]MDW8439735.1 hypothetical protein [Caldilineaceae bacterium]